MAKDAIQFYQFNAGYNPRDGVIANNELRHSKNIYWQGNALKRRGGYLKRNGTLSATSLWGSSDVIGIEEHLHYKWGSSDVYFLFVSVDSGGGSIPDKLVVFYNSDGIPDTTTETFTPLGSTSYAINWTSSDPIQVAQLYGCVYIAVGDKNPYVLYNDGGTWKTREFPMCETYNDGSTAGADIIPDDGWFTTDWVASFDNFIYFSDKRLLYFGIANEDGNPCIGVTGTAATFISGIEDSMDTTWLMSLPPDVNLRAAVPYRNYLFMYGSGGIWHLYNRFTDANPGDYDKQQITSKGVRGDMLVTPNYIFWVSDDGVYGYDGTSILNLGKKIWSHIIGEHSSLPDDFDDCSWAIHEDKIWFSFPNGSNAEVYCFDPDYIYVDESGDNFIASYPQVYPSRDFEHFKSYDGHLLAVDDAQLYELETGYEDNGTTNIDYAVHTSYLDLDNPAYKKTWGRVILETTANMEAFVDTTVTFKRDYGEDSVAAYAIDTTYTDNVRSFVELTVPYQIDGNSISLEIDGSGNTGSGATDVFFYGFSIEYDIKQRAKKEM